MKKILFYALLFAMAACGNGDQKVTMEDTHQAPLAKSANSAAFNQSFGRLMTTYYSLKDYFIDENTGAIDQSAAGMMRAADSLQLSQLQGDTNLIATAKTYVDGISAELKGLAGETDLEAKRKSFQMVSDQLYDLIRTVQYDQAVIYHQFCPMAFNDQGANWLSSYAAIKNPYIPKKMISCGEVKDSIDFRPKL